MGKAGKRGRAERSRLIHLYAIRLDECVLGSRAFRDANPGYREGKPCYYIGSSIHTPAIRFAKHKRGERASKWVRRHGRYVAGRKCRVVEVVGKAERDHAERSYAEYLRSRGYGIWQN